ncbi:MAG TPA: type II secretion system F family protein [Candidatus Paceibacterota bacterium]|nr:type II secretion system F family protein [Candidatus Paceibacterota bacterium]
MIFTYKALDKDGRAAEGTIDAANVDIAITSLQRKNLIITDIRSAEEASQGLLRKNISFFSRISTKEVVILSRQMSILFESQVSALRVFRLLGAENENQQLRVILTQVADDIQGGSPISAALAKHPKVFSAFYVNMIKAGEESGKLSETLVYLADYLERSYEVTSKTTNALIYPAFIVATFIAVMILMFTMVIPKISLIIEESGQEIPIYTKIIMGISNFMVAYWPFLGIGAIIAGFFAVRFLRTDQGRAELDEFKLKVPYVGDLYKKLFLSRIADNMNVMILSGIPMIRTLEITSDIVGNKVYKGILEDAIISVRAGSAVSDVFARYPEMPGILIQMMKVGEETGQLGVILKTLARFYQREVVGAIDTLIGLIEPVMIVVLGVGVAILLASVLVPIYNIAGTI